MTVELKDVDRENFKHCVALKVAEGQERFVATNVMSLAQSKVMPELIPQAVYVGDEMVGFVLYGRDTNDGRWWLVRLMVGSEHQGNGYGKAAVLAVVERLQREAPDCEELYLSFVPGNERAERLYLDLGFAPTGEVEEGEVVFRLPLGE